MRLLRYLSARSRSAKTVHLNCLAGLISLISFLVLVLNFHATPVGAGVERTEEEMPPMPASTQVAAKVGETSTAAGSTAVSADELNRQVQSAVSGSRVALQLHLALLELGKARVEKFPDYTATFVKRERLDGEDLQELQTMQLKLRHKPFSLYLKWQEGGDVGREILYVDGQHEQRMLVHPGGLKGKLLPALKLEPNGSMAMAEARHPVTELGLSCLADQLISYRKRDLGLARGVRWEMMDDQKIGDRDCHCFVIEYASKEVEPVYRKSITYIDKELLLPICVRNFGWPADGIEVTPTTIDGLTMIEYYAYSEIKFDTRLGDLDFDKGNKDYTFRR